MTFYPETLFINLSGHFGESHPMTDTRHFIIDMTVTIRWEKVILL